MPAFKVFIARSSPGLAVLALATFLAASLAWWYVPDLYPVPSTPPDQMAIAAMREATRSQAIVTTRASVLAALAGVGAIFTIWINLRNSRTQAETATIAARTLETTNETFRVTERGHLTDRYTEAVKQLGDDSSIAVRLGGIYALEQLVEDSTRRSDHATIVEVLSAFIRVSVDEAPRDAHGHRSIADHEPVPPDVQAALTVLGRLPSTNGQVRADLSWTVLPGALLSHGNWRGASFVGAHLAEAKFEYADLSEADLTSATLCRADLSDSCLIGATMLGTSLDGANFTGADLRDSALIQVTLEGARWNRVIIGETAHLPAEVVEGARKTDGPRKFRRRRSKLLSYED